MNLIKINNSLQVTENLNSERTNEINIKLKLAEIRTRFNKLKSICGLQYISRETLEFYKKQIDLLEAQIK